MKPIRTLVGCETSGVVRRAFADRGHDAWSCDLLPSEDGSNRHIVGDVRDFSMTGGIAEPAAALDRQLSLIEAAFNDLPFHGQMEALDAIDPAKEAERDTRIRTAAEAKADMILMGRM